jgi:hypothetical protein
MKTVQKWLPYILAFIPTIGLAQTDAALPKELSGRWTTTVPGAGTFTDVLSVVFDAPAQPGPVAGHVTIRGVFCGSKDEPLVGNWDGTELRFESKVYPNVNVARSNGQCGTGQVTYVLRRIPGQSAFEGESRRDGASAPVQVTLSPAQMVPPSVATACGKIALVYFSARDCTWCTYWESGFSGMKSGLEKSPEFKKINFVEVKRDRIAAPPSKSDYPEAFAWLRDRIESQPQSLGLATPAWHIYVDKNLLGRFWGTENWNEKTFPEIKRIVNFSCPS